MTRDRAPAQGRRRPAAWTRRRGLHPAEPADQHRARSSQGGETGRSSGARSAGGVAVESGSATHSCTPCSVGGCRPGQLAVHDAAAGRHEVQLSRPDHRRSRGCRGARPRPPAASSPSAARCAGAPRPACPVSRGRSRARSDQGSTRRRSSGSGRPAEPAPPRWSCRGRPSRRQQELLWFRAVGNRSTYRSPAAEDQDHSL